MSQTLPTPDHQPSDRLPVPGAAAVASPVHRRQLERSVSWSGRERLRFLWYRLRLTVAEMNYASRRMTDIRLGLPDDLWQRP
jgi:hypothetical protein